MCVHIKSLKAINGGNKNSQQKFSKLFAAFIMASVISAATVSSNASKVLAQTATLEDILAEITRSR